VYPLEIIPQRPEFLHRPNVKLRKRFCDALIRDPCPLEVSFREHTPEDWLMPIVARTVRNEEHMHYPCVVFLSLTVTIVSVDKQINNAFLPDFISLEPCISLYLF
jgi:hypothetical protein